MAPHKTMADRSGYLLDHIASITHRQFDQSLQERLGIGVAQYNIMSMLQAYPDIPQRRLGVGLGQTEASISRQIKLLERRGMVAVKIDPSERRRRLVSLTGRGIRMAEAAEDVLATQREQLLGALTSKEQGKLHEMLDKLHHHACQPGKTLACDRPFDLLDAYNAQREVELSQ